MTDIEKTESKIEPVCASAVDLADDALQEVEGGYVPPYTKSTEDARAQGVVLEHSDKRENG
jgi:hypothetical protein